MIKVKDGYAKLIGTTYLGSADRVLLSNGSDKVIGNASGNIPISNGTVNTNLNADLLDGKHDGELTAKYLKSLGRLTTASNIYGDGLLRYYQASSDMTTDKPYNDGLILHSSWTNLNQGGYEALLFLSVDSSLMLYRRASAGTWQPWKTIAFTDSNITGTASYAKYLKSSSTNITTSLDSGLISYSRMPKNYAGNLPYSSNANGVITISTHEGNYHHLLGFTGKGMFYRNMGTDIPLDETTAWNTILHSGNYSSYLGYIGTTPVQASSAALALTGITNATISELTSTGTLIITNTSGVGHINFSRNSWNYVTTPSGGAIVLSPGLQVSATLGYQFFNTAFLPGVTNTYDIGTSSLRWKNIYSILGNYSGLLTASKGVLIGDTADYGWYGGNGGRITAGTKVARGVNVGSLLVSSAWADADKVPTNGIYSKGNVTTSENLIAKNGYFNYGLADYNCLSGTIKGTFVITLPNGWVNSMNTYEIDIYEYTNYEASDNILHSKIIISGYNYSNTPGWYNYGYQQIGSYNKGVRLGYNGSKCCILLGNTSTTWSYPQVHLSRVITGYFASSHWSSGYTINIITDESAYSKTVVVNRTRQRFDDVIANTFRGNLVGKSTSVGTDSMIVYPELDNEINFGGTTNANTIYIGYRAVDAKPIPSTFVFGGINASATLKASKFAKSGSTNDYVLLGGGDHKAISDFVLTTTLGNYVTLNTAQTITGAKTFYGDVNSLIIKRNSSSYGAYITFENNSKRLGMLGITAAKNIYFYEETNTSTPFIVLHSGNYTDYTVKKDGTGASGTWNINITGNADTLDSLHSYNFVQKLNLSESNDKLLSTKVFKMGVSNMGDDSTLVECPTRYGAYISIQYLEDKNLGYLFFGNTSNNIPTLYVRNRVAGNGNTTYNDWKQIAFTSDIPTVTNYYWANVPISATSNSSTSPTFANATTTGLLTVSTGASHRGIKAGSTYINSISGDLIFQNNGAIRFGGDSWDYNVWAGLKYVHSSKTISLGLADGTHFTANTPLSDGTLNFPGISNIMSSYYKVAVGCIMSHTPSTAGWYRVAKLTGYFNYDIHISGGWNNGSPSIIKVNICQRNGDAKITLLAGKVGTIASSIRLGKVATNEWDVLFYVPSYSGPISLLNFVFFGYGSITIYSTNTASTTSYTSTLDLAFKTLSGISLTTDNYSSYLDSRYYTESEADSRFVNTAGDTMTGALTLASEKYTGNYALNMSNSDIVNLNSIYTSDLANGGNEGIQFARTNGNYDSLWAADGVLYFSPNGNNSSHTGSYSANYPILHTGNSSVSKSGQTLTVTINGVSLSITDTTYSFSASNPTLSWGTTSTIGTAGGATYKVTMPSNPNSHYTTGIKAGASGTNANGSATNPYIKVLDDSTYRSQIRLIGGGSTTVSSDTSGNITISSEGFDDSVLDDYLPLSGGTMTGSIITPKNDNMGIIPHTNNYGQIGSSDKKFFRMYATTFYGALSGNASSADKLNTNAGSATNPVYFSGGVPVACTYSLNKTVPSNAVFTDTTYSAGTGLSLSGTTFSLKTTNAGDSWTPIYLSNGTFSTTTPSFKGSSTQPIILACGIVLRSSESSDTWSFLGSSVSGITVTVSVSSTNFLVDLNKGYIKGVLAHVCGIEQKFDNRTPYFVLSTHSAITRAIITAMAIGEDGYPDFEAFGSDLGCVTLMEILIMGYFT